jgi:hypothetical protein
MILGHGIKSKLFGAVIASALLSGHVTVANPQHGIAMYGAPALPHDFVSLPYANPTLPRVEPSFPQKEAPSPRSIRMFAKARCLGSFDFWPMRA